MIDLDTDIVKKALRIAGCKLVKHGRGASISLEQDLAQAIRIAVAEAHQERIARTSRDYFFEEWMRSPTWSAEDMRNMGLAITPKDKGPRPYHTATVKVRPALSKEVSDRVFLGIDYAKPGSDMSGDHPKVVYGVDDHEGREAQRKADAARIAKVMGWRD